MHILIVAATEKRSIQHTELLLRKLEQELKGVASSNSFPEAAHGRVALWQKYSRILKRSKYLEEQLGLAKQRLGVKQRELRAAHFRACEDRMNRQCHECGLWREVDLAPCFHLVCRGCFQRHVRCPRPYIYTGPVGERPVSSRASGLLDEIAYEVRTLQEGPWVTSSIWGEGYLIHHTRRLKARCKWLEQQLASTRQEYEKALSILSLAHAKATLDRRNRPCEGCLRTFPEVYLAPCFDLVCRGCYPDPGEEGCKMCRAKHRGISAPHPSRLPPLAV